MNKHGFLVQKIRIDGSLQNIFPKAQQQRKAMQNMAEKNIEIRKNIKALQVT